MKPRGSISVAVLLAGLAGQTSAEQATFLAQKDSRIESTDGTDCANNAGGGTIMSVRAATKGVGVQRSVVHFDLSSIPHQSTVLSATLQLFVDIFCCTTSVPVQIERVTRTDWTETGVLWTAADCLSAKLWCAAGADFTISNGVTWDATTSGWSQIPLAPLVQEALDRHGGQLDLLLHLQDENDGNGVDIRTRQWAGSEPTLAGQWSPPPGLPPPSPWVSFRDETGSRLNLTTVPTNDPEEKDIAVGDFDDDGDDDIIVGRKLPFSNSGPRAPLLLLNKDGILTDVTASKFVNPATGAPLAPAPTDARDVFVGDLDGGGRGDLVFANTCEQNPTSYRNQEGRCANWLGFALRNDWIPPAFSSSGKRFCAVWGGDVNRDGNLDLYLSNYEDLCNSTGSQLISDVLLINRGGGLGFTDETAARLGTPLTPTSLANVSFGTAVEIHDLDGNGPEIIKITTQFTKPIAPFNDDDVYILRNDGTGNFLPLTNPSVHKLNVPAPYMFTAGDLNKDGRLDFYVVNDGQDTVHIATGPLTFEPIPRQVNSNRTADMGGNVKLGDIDGDGNLDVGVADVDVDIQPCEALNPARKFALLKNDGTGTMLDPFATDQNFHLNTWDFAFLDLNRDGCLDLFMGVCSGYKVFINTTPPKCQGGL